ncbi:MAG: response regulator transcription factor [Bacteroidota bacterium]
MKTIKVAIVDDHDLFIEGLQLIFRTIEEADVLFTASGGLELFDRLSEQQPDIILLDLALPVMNGKEIIQVLNKDFPNIKVIVLTMHAQERMISYMIEQGAVAYLPKNITREKLREALLQVSEKGQYFTTEVTQAMANALKQKSRLTPQFEHEITLTEREQEVLELLSQGLSNVEIGDRLFISHKTVDGHRTNLLSKFQVRNTARLIRKAIEEGYLKV